MAPPRPCGERRAASRPSSEALKVHSADAVVDDVPDLLRQIDGDSARVAGKAEHLIAAGF